ncbi:FecR family protein [Chitinophaga silvatica]|uniref:FecR family protein n=1 Tax=Chitinophaga silvatica TaxID=2282649 RepID=A0A3E1Y8J2_9BACT|nr:FecR family protein [Chitinophaga silvatica]RFS21710.1 FecR family protein [Chitinophaga silvatica]
MANITEALLIKYLDNNCNEAEKAIVEAYLQQPESNAILNLLLEERMEKDIEESTEGSVNKERQQQWAADMRVRMGREDKVKPMRKRYYVAAVAAASVLLMAGLFALLNNGRSKTTVPTLALQQNKAGERKIIQLSDGSTIHLGAASQLQYPEQFTGETREITLNGEAFFEIATDPGHPFIIHTGSIATTVLGTSFKIAAFEGQPLVVSVATGKVRVDDSSNGQIRQLAILTAGKQVSWINEKASLENIRSEDVAGWQTGRLVFNNQTLQEVATTLERWYDVKISFSHSQKAKEKVTITLFAGAALKTTLQTLALGNNFNYSTKDREVIIY